MLAKVCSSPALGVNVRKTRILRCLIAAVIPLVLSACAVNVLPIPHVATVVPSIEGRITEDGVPVANRTIIYHWEKTEEGWMYTAETTTSPEGYFSFPSKSRFRLVEIIVVAADCKYAYKLTIKDSDGDMPLIEDYFFQACNAPPSQLKATCDLGLHDEDKCEVIKAWMPQGEE
ncbi:MAG: hypothetical protein C4532_17085 [Candidatus Abyssobacteria bacterium SURF_17]|uniref:DUF6795 domain-containing protein n=1 Tax=Candidatus Abyssobacteria bacterium SURF_17 TaxID=2093361 RepID=A0A419ER92_9BACT|nr:MAG: hypothetical protein C4532_17085 [Candidatus Abyssubacteria bacterium SURF_17]